MADKTQFKNDIIKEYKFEGDSIIMGAGMLGEEVITDHFIRIPLSTLNRHGLISGATGTGKTKTLQILLEQLSHQGVPSLVMDVKGDLSGIAVPAAGHPKIDERHEKIGLPFVAGSSPVEFLSLSDEKGARLRATISEFGPILFSKILELNDVQSSIISVVFKFCDDNQLPLLDLEDLKKVLQYIMGDGKDAFVAEYGRTSSASIGAIMRKIIELEQQGADTFFGEKSFEVDDLLRVKDGKGVVSILRLVDIQDKPKLFSTFMLQLLAEIYTTFPEEGDMDKPKLCIFIDEAHLVFDEASDALLDQIEVIIKLIRSKGVGVFFITQNPVDIPDSVLGQLGLKIQHALRAFTAKDRKAIRLAAQNFPLSDYYDVDEVLTVLGTGEALLTVLNEKGRPSMLVRTYMRAPQSRMDILTPQEIDHLIHRSNLVAKYNEEIDRESAHEILTAKIEDAHSKEIQEHLREQEKAARRGSRREKSTFDKVLNSTTTRQIGRTVARELTRGLLGVLGVNKTSRKSSKSSFPWF